MADLIESWRRTVMRTEFRVIALSVLFFVIVCLADTVLDSFVLNQRSFWDSLLFDSPPLHILHRSLVTLSFLVFGLVVSGLIRKRRRIEEALAERSDSLALANDLLNKEIIESNQLENDLRRS